MSFYLKTFVASIILLGAFDYIWLGHIAKPFNDRQLQEIAILQGGEVAPLKAPAALVYLLMAIALTAFAAPFIQEDSLWKCALSGALLGLCIYGIYDFTNLAILKNYPLKFALVDMAWGTFSFGLANTCLFFLRRWLV